jgi:hypothetical protein
MTRASATQFFCEKSPADLSAKDPEFSQKTRPASNFRRKFVSIHPFDGFAWRDRA